MQPTGLISHLRISAFSFFLKSTMQGRFAGKNGKRNTNHVKCTGFHFIEGQSHMSEKKKLKSEQVKKSIVLSGLVGTAGLFFAKMLGLFYSIPLSSILSSDAYMSYYGTAYRIYSYILNVFTAGFPLAISTLVAKYTVRNDARALRKIKKISTLLLGCTGFLGMLILFVLSWPLGGVVAGKEDAAIMGTCLRILSLAIFFVPVLSSFRGFWQGRKEMGEYAVSQVFEQVFRVGFLLSMAYLLVYVLHIERKYALYVAVISTSVAAVAGILQIYCFDRKHYAEIEEKARRQKTKTVRKKVLMREFIALAVPYLLVAVLGYSDDLYNSIFLPIGLKVHGYTSSESSIILSAFNYVGTKMTAIPMILSPGFAAALIPHITAARTEGNDREISRNVIDCLNIIWYVGLPVSFCIFLYSADVYHILFYTKDPVTASQCLRWLTIEGFLGTLTPVITNLLMALGMRREALKNLVVNLVIKGITIVPMIWLLGYPGAVLCTIPGNLFIIIASCRSMNRKYGIRFGEMIQVAVKSAVCLAAMFAVCWGLRLIGLDGSQGGKAAALVKFVMNGLIVMAAYIVLTSLLKLPEMVFHANIFSFIRKKFGKKHAA